MEISLSITDFSKMQFTCYRNWCEDRELHHGTSLLRLLSERSRKRAKQEGSAFVSRQSLDCGEYGWMTN